MNARFALSVIAAAGSAAVVACVLADPPPIVTPPPVQAPLILSDSVTPSLTEILHSNPCPVGSDCFNVPVQVDPDQTVLWRVFVDLDQKGSPTQDAIIKEQDDGGVLGVTGEAGSGIRNFSFGIPESLVDMSRCHTFTFIVAYDFVSNDFSKPVTPPGGSSATWFYQPVANCTAFDAGGLVEGGGAD